MSSLQIIGVLVAFVMLIRLTWANELAYRQANAILMVTLSPSVGCPTVSHYRHVLWVFLALDPLNLYEAAVRDLIAKRGYGDLFEVKFTNTVWRSRHG